ncbi:hypothetical protein CSC62_01170 [Pseudoxanthomonas jiangsuensis]|uniref:hypothetical protein n=1 Tax=Pseudoxanthomonas jiangsuensis TaxID=619688 RepID=UPI00139113FB|nr:hypothetical protein [Pseudoxanthomonas jiangsuensis]KAF1699543.1 hypothetical protein CSC62_01170 [Pseudoxanthomonas jiangsuensis]
MKIAIYLMTLAVALHASAADVQAFWGGAAYGMDVAQVQARVPQARVPDNPDELAGGEREGLRVEGVAVAGHRFQASYFFDGGALVQVDLVQEAPRAGRADLQVFQDVAAALEARHGAPAGSTQEDEPFERRRVHWQVAETQVALLLFQVGDASLVKVVYQVQR